MLNKLEKGLTHAENAVNGFLILAGVLVLFVNIIARAVFHNASSWAEEAIRYAIGWEATQLVIQTSQKSIAMLMPMWIVYISVPLGCLLMAIRFLVAGINYLRNTNNSSLILDEEGNVDLNKL